MLRNALVLLLSRVVIIMGLLVLPLNYTLLTVLGD
jgi:hypothetical protein